MSEPVFGLIGRTLKHSWSVPIHRELGCGSYALYELEPDALPSFLTGNEIGGLNVTIPYKKTVIPLCGRLDPAAEAIGSVNTIVRGTDGVLTGHNTDAAGFSYMAARAGISFDGASVLILGSGGTSLTAGYVASTEGAREIRVVSRSGELNYSNVKEEARDAQIIVNTTPVGMYPDNGKSLLDLRDFPELKGVIDVIYNPRRTALLLQAEALGIPCSGGLPMLVSQAVEAERIFTGRDIPDSETERILNMLYRQTMNIVLIGMPGSGKTTVGQLLAAKTGRRFIDVDTEIEREAGKPIPAIFRDEGEDGFRNRETAATAAAGKETGVIIATGGGVVTRTENRDLLRQNGVIFKLERDLDLLPVSGRPISQSTDVHTIYMHRAPLYEAFRDHDADNSRTAEETADRIWREYCESFGD